MTNQSDAIFPNILWAQRAELVLITIPLQDATNVVVEIKEGRVLHFEAEAGGEKYRCDVELFREVVSEESRHAAQPRQIDIQLRKKAPLTESGEEEFAQSRSWLRLTRDKSKNSHIQVDWSRWRDEDEDEDETGGLGMDYNDLMSRMMTQKGLGEDDCMDCGNHTDEDGVGPGADKANHSDSDDYDDLPPLEP
ncbi:hypothetical protein, conserved [Trypanosoma brucei brucei TREU927]|uniref:CS domain-containing protein n=1 Tax=Trypanosoma brucei brucei (strain 927/4 GUTat10.1) TaxID=185431 RepID=Q38BY3_TRYB2|nr:hypothetical protein, conserved [Trypanosoma brucei brucei TREU927]EAN77687.1 hypothetical protein, conserved [Trypanosoma brucei brucei TREU927]